jgi:cytochrome c oxidase assembly protein subunit 15
LARGFVLLAATTYCLIVLGALVRANGAGLACPDWPLCFGQLVPQFDFRVALEWGHRVLAGLVSLGLLALSWAGWRREELRARLKPRLAIAWALLATQVVFGGLTVLLGLAPWTVSAHLLLGNAFCLTLLWSALDLFDLERGPTAREPLAFPGPALVAVTATCLLLQLVLGGLVAGHAAGLACPTFPTCDGHSLAPTLGGSVGLQVLHRVHGLLLLASFALLAWVTRRSGRVGRLARTGLRLVLVQIAIGVANVLLQLPVEVTALHTATAAAIVLATALLARELVLARGGASAGGLAREAR